MNRLQTKCVFASAAAHLLLLAMLVVGSAFVKAPPKTEDVRFVRLFDASKVTDDETQGGGNPNVPSNATPPPQAAVIPQPVSQVNIEPPIKQPEPKPKAKTPEPAPEVKKPEPKPQVKKPEPKPEPTPKIALNPNSTKIVPKNKLTPQPVKPEPRKIEVDIKTVKTAKDDPEAKRRQEERERAAKAERERREAERQAEIRAHMQAVEAANRDYKQRQAALSGIVGKVDTGLARTTNIEMPGPGGEAFINYADLIWTKYYQAWVAPDVSNVRNPTRVEIVVTKDGRVISSNIIKSSGNTQLDNSVRQALARVARLPAFPEGATDAQRTFRINFELKSKRQFG
jgi:colicin import membrane protein